MDQSTSMPIEAAGAAQPTTAAPAETRRGIAELCLLLSAGALAAIAVMHVELSLGIPGHAILYFVPSMALGFSLVPRRFSGFLMSAAGVGTLAGYYAVGAGTVGAGDLARLAALGPLLDLAASAPRRGWRLYARFAAAAVTTNLIAFATKLALAYSGLDMGRHGFLARWPTGLASYISCGVLAGVLIAACRARSRRSESINPEQGRAET